MNVGEATTNAIEAAREAAEGLGISEDEAAMQLARGALEAAEALRPEAAQEVKEAVLEELVGDISDEPTKNGA